MTASARFYTHRPGVSRMGRSTIYITCPWCGNEFVAYLWSLAGSGKRCPVCKALHHWGHGLHADCPPNGKKVIR